METTSQNEQGAGRIAAALSASLKALSEVQESQKRIEDWQKKSGEELARYDKRLAEIEKKETGQYDIMARNSKVLGDRLSSIDGHLKSVLKKNSSMEKKLEARLVERDLFWGFLPKKWLLWVAILAFGVLFGRAWGFKVQMANVIEWNRDNTEFLDAYDP